MGALGLFLLVVFAPVTETLIMALFLWILTRFLPATLAIVLSALGWGVAHSMMAPAWGLAIWFPFLIFSTLYVVWRQRSLGWALAMPMMAHALQNLLPAIPVSYPHLFAV
nr:CPBP family glutamic-type intramembrane protease [Sphingomicrobium nitratireducens]